MTKGPDKKKTILDYAFEYHQLGWSIIPIGFNKKPPRGFKWEKYQKTQPIKAELQQWFGDGKYKSLAVICGTVSGSLAVLDLDSEERCRWWRKEHSDLAETLPTSETKKGLHVFFCCEPIRKKNGDNIDLLCEGAYAILPPSPNKEWRIPLNGELPLLNPFEWGLEQFGIQKPISLKSPNNIQDVTERTDENKGEKKRLVFVVVDKKIREAITNTLPTEYGTRHLKIFYFARELYSMPEYTDADPKQFKTAVREWHKRALPNIRTKEFEETWIDFIKAWPKIKYKIGDEPMARIFETAIQLEPPKIAMEKYPQNNKLKILVSLCRELQRAAGNNPFFLSVRTAGKLLGVSHMQVSRWFFLMEADGILKVVVKGGTAESPRNATRFRYVAN